MTLRSLDHVVVIVEDLDAEAGRLEQAGFQVTGRSDHPFGTSNRLVMLDGTYIELIGVTGTLTDSPFARFVSASLDAGRTGPRLVVFRSDDPEADAAELAAEGLSAEAVRFGRQARLPDGSEARVEFVTLVPSFADHAVAGFLCHHVTPDIVWHPPLLVHPNGARRLVRVDVSDPGPGAWARIAAMAGAPGGPPVQAANAVVDRGAPRLVIEGETPSATTVAGTLVEVAAPQA